MVSKSKTCTLVCTRFIKQTIEKVIQDVGCALLVAVKLVAVDAVRVHAGAVADEVFEQGFGHFQLGNADEGVTKFMEGDVDSVLLSVDVGPVVVDRLGL